MSLYLIYLPHYWCPSHPLVAVLLLLPISTFDMSPMVLENDVEVGESLPPATEHVRPTSLTDSIQCTNECRLSVSHCRHGGQT